VFTRHLLQWRGEAAGVVSPRVLAGLVRPLTERLAFVAAALLANRASRARRRPPLLRAATGGGRNGGRLQPLGLA